MAEDNNPTETNTAEDSSFLYIRGIYVKDISFESPNAPRIFASNDFNLNMDMQVRVGSEKVDENLIEVIVEIALHAKSNEQTAYVVEIQQAGLFNMGGYNSWDQLRWMTHVFCPNMLFPYARAEIARLIIQGGFPPYHLEPINFDAMFKDQLEELSKQDQENKQARQVEQGEQ